MPDGMYVTDRTFVYECQVPHDPPLLRTLRNCLEDDGLMKKSKILFKQYPVFDSVLMKKSPVDRSGGGLQDFCEFYDCTLRYLVAGMLPEKEARPPLRYGRPFI